MFCFHVVQVELESVLCPVSDYFTMYVMINVVFSLLTSHEAMGVFPVLKSLGRGPSAKDSAPKCVSDSRAVRWKMVHRFC